MEEPRHGAIIQLSAKVLLEGILDFKGAKLHDVWLDRERFEPGVINVKIEHPDLPEAFPGALLVQVTPTYVTDYGDNGSIIRNTRIDPPKL
jgi:hypothetical protein